jgi:hypothetical protein
VRLRTRLCKVFCSEYGGRAAFSNTEDKYNAVYKMIQKTNEKLGITGSLYSIGLERYEEEEWKWGRDYYGEIVDKNFTASRWAIGELDKKSLNGDKSRYVAVMDSNGKLRDEHFDDYHLCVCEMGNFKN